MSTVKTGRPSGREGRDVRQGVLFWFAVAAYAAAWWLGAYHAGRWLAALICR
jgi:hypothetical protein